MIRSPSLSALLAVPFVLTSLVVGGAGCASSAAADEEIAVAEDELRTSYGDLLETLEPADLDRWIDVRAKLASGFDRICGDTICGGDFSNLATVRIACASTKAARKMKDCVWILGGNIDYVDAASGAITGEARAFTCHIPVAGKAKPFLDALAAAGDDALNTPLPGTNASFYDGLVACFDGVVGAPPPAGTAGDFAELGDFFWEQGSAGAAWSETKRKLVDGFDDACGDSFCEGELSDITGLRFACAVNRTTKNVPRCSWTFALANTDVDSRGRIRATTATKRCDVEVNASATALRRALAGDDPLHAKLPGKTTSIYDALIGCL